MASSTPTMRVFIVDDIPAAREGLCALFRLMPDIEVVGEATNGVEALERILADPPDVVFMDFEMPRLDGMEATRQLRQQGLSIHIVVLSIADDRREDALAAGADDFIHKGEPLSKLSEILEGFRRSQSLRQCP